MEKSTSLFSFHQKYVILPKESPRNFHPTSSIRYTPFGKEFTKKENHIREVKLIFARESALFSIGK